MIARTVTNTEGRVEEVEIGEDFDAAVREVLKEWEFEPATLRGEPVAVYYNLTFKFRLDSKKSKETEAVG